MDQTILQTRLAALQHEFSSGTRMLAEQEARTAALREQLLRISGAMRVLSELLGNGQTPAPEEAAAAHVAGH